MLRTYIAQISYAPRCCRHIKNKNKTYKNIYFLFFGFTFGIARFPMHHFHGADANLVLCFLLKTKHPTQHIYTYNNSKPKPKQHNFEPTNTKQTNIFALNAQQFGPNCSAVSPNCSAVWPKLLSNFTKLLSSLAQTAQQFGETAEQTAEQSCLDSLFLCENCSCSV